MHLHYFQHDHFEDLGYIAEWAAVHNFTISCTRLDIKPDLPSHNAYDWLVVLGGKMGVYETDQHEWINTEIEFIKEAIALGKVVIGICLGAQMVAKALGARVYKNTEPEMGFYPVHFNKNAQTDSFFSHFPKSLTVMHMHFDTFELPEGAISLAESEITACQAFRIGKNVFALQFHFEVSVENAAFFIQEVTPEIIPGRMVQQPSEMLAYINHCNLNNQIFAKLLTNIKQQNF